MPIGEFARRTGLTASALRFYADSGVLPPAEIDATTGYRHYAEQQVARATRLRQLRDIAMPLGRAGQVLDADDLEASRLVDEHVAIIVDDARRAQRTAEVLRSSLMAGDVQLLTAVSGPVLATALDQVLSASSPDPDLPVLNSVHLEIEASAITLTATDLFRLARRTLVSAKPSAVTWSGIVHADDLRLAAPAIRRSSTVALAAGTGDVQLQIDDGEDQRCRLVAGEYPDHRQMLSALPDVVTRVLVPRDLFERSLELAAASRVRVSITAGAVAVTAVEGEQGSHPLAATVTGNDSEVWFETTTLYPAVASAVGPDVMLDLRGPDQPATIRSADRGDLTTLVMPVHPDQTEQESR